MLRRVHKKTRQPAPSRVVATGNDPQPALCRPIVRQLEIQQPPEPVPVWLAALLATPCVALGNGGGRAVLWNLGSGKALYTNAGADTVLIHPLGISLGVGQTLAVSWRPGSTEYTLEVA